LSDSGIERRKNGRVKYELNVSFQGTSRGYLESYDISAFGMFLKTEKPLPLESKLFITFTLPESPAPIKTYGKVAWINQGQSDDGQPEGMGIHFLNISEFNRKRLEKFLTTSMPFEIKINSEDHTLFDFSHASKENFQMRSEKLYSYISDMEEKGYYTYRRPLTSSASNKVMVYDEKLNKEKEMIMLASNNYLGLADHPEVVEAGKKAIEKYGLGTASAPMLSGTFELHKELEEKIAKFIGAEKAIIFPSGYSASVGTISGIIRNNDVVFIDRMAHASLIDGCLMSGVRFRTFRHNDVKNLEVLLSKADPKDDKLVVVEGVYSMDGDLPPLPEVVELAKKYNAKILLDEAHAIGVLGDNGKGSASHFGVEGEIDITLGTFSKSLGQMGGFVASSKYIVNYLRHYGRSYFFSASPPPVIIAAVLKALELVQRYPELQKQLWENINYFKYELNSMGFNTGESNSAVIPVIVGDEKTLKKMSVRMDQEGIYVNPIPYPATPRDNTLFRISLMATHSREDLDYALSVFKKVGTEFGIINNKKSSEITA